MPERHRKGCPRARRGASISEASETFAVRLDPSGGIERLGLPNGPRHNEARSIVALGNDRFLVGGMHDGPGTHSADADASLLRASGSLSVLALDEP